MGSSYLKTAIVWLLWCATLLASDGNSAYFLGDENEAASARWDLLAGEKQEITAVVHIWEVNKLGLAGLAGLRAAAQNGAKVRLVIDGFGAQFWNPQSAFYPQLVSALKQSGVEVRVFNPVPGPIALLSPGTLNRLHNKILYFGSQDIALTGDRNFQNANFPHGRKRDGTPTDSFTSVETLVKGPAAQEARDYINLLLKASQPLPDGGTPQEIAREIANLDRVARVMKNAGHVAQDWGAKLQPVTDVQFLGETPRRKVDHAMTKSLIALIEGAKENVRMTVPFNLLSAEFERALKRAAKRGVNVQLLLPNEESRHEHGIVAQAFRIQGNRLTNAGVKINEYDQKKWLHAKFIVVDGHSTFIGTHNFNPRSVETDLESGFVINDVAFGKQSSEFFDELVREKSKPYVPRRLTFWENCRAGLFRIIGGMPGLRSQL